MADGFNIDTYKRQLTEYQKKGYDSDVAAVMEKATRYVLDRASEFKRPAVVLDIDETSLSNWDNIKADDYGFIEEGPCPMQAKKACGFNDWIDLAIAPAIEPTLKFFHAIRAKEDTISRKENSEHRRILYKVAARSSAAPRCGISIALGSRAGRGSRTARTMTMARSCRSRAGNAITSRNAIRSLPILVTKTAILKIHQN
jgi:HAD superfamily, subfamily IIIB (Acid phosphatase)